ncbi:hypothetical protein ACFLU6_14115, partial [Acidobacteriota bacterium]
MSDMSSKDKPLEHDALAQRIPDGPWGLTWLFALVVVILFLGSLEAMWRGLGFSPSLHDNAGLWALHRLSIPANDPSAVVLLGGSRMNLAVKPDTFAAEAGCREPVMLAINASPALPLLEDFA